MEMNQDSLVVIAIVTLFAVVIGATLVFVFIVKAFFKSLSGKKSPAQIQAEIAGQIAINKAKAAALMKQQEYQAAIARQAQGEQRLESTVQHNNRTPFASQEAQMVAHAPKSAAPTPVKSSTPTTEESQTLNNEPKSATNSLATENFDLRKAVLYSEILRPKYDE